MSFQPVLHTHLGAALAVPSGAAALYHPSMSAAFRQMAPTRYFVFFIFHLPFFVFFLFLAGEPVPVGFKPVRWLRPQPIPIPVVQKVFPPGQPYPKLPQPLVSDGAAGLDNHLMASHHGLLLWVFSVRM